MTLNPGRRSASWLASVGPLHSGMTTSVNTTATDGFYSNNFRASAAVAAAMTV
jgi:hypothetical protein